MSIVKIIKVPDVRLTEKCKKVAVHEAQTQQTITDLIETLENAKNPEGAGLAAPQIGVMRRICIVRRFIPDPTNPDNTLKENYVLVNPEIIQASAETDVRYEGCLSIPDTYGPVERSKRIKIRALNRGGEEIKMNASGFFARVIQHEVDHLNGVLFTTKLAGKTLTEKELDELIEAENS